MTATETDRPESEKADAEKAETDKNVDKAEPESETDRVAAPTVAHSLN